MKLLSTGNPKVLKGMVRGFNTYILHLAPASLSGFNTCPKATAGCTAACLNTAGRGGMFKKGETTNVIQKARIRKTQLFFNNRETFMALLVKDIELAIKQSAKINMVPVIRLNGTSDLSFEKYAAIRNGVEYKNIPNVMLRKEYWKGAIDQMLKINNNMKFIIVSDDPVCARSFMPFDIPCYHFDIGFDFYVVNQAKWLIISNSSFGWWAAWLNQNSKLTIAPKYWARHNVSNGYWATGDIYTRCFKYLDRERISYDTSQLTAALAEFKRVNF